jgi:hypothetical protein
MRKLILTLTAATIVFFAGNVVNRAAAFTLDTPGLRAAIEDIDMIERAHCRSYWHSHWHLGYGCGAGAVVVPPRVYVAPRPRVYVAPRPGIYVAPRRW